MPIVDLSAAVHNPTPFAGIPSAWGDGVNANFEEGFRNRPHCRIYNNANISIATATVTALTFNSERYDIGPMHSTSSLTSRVVVPSGWGGVYSFVGNVSWAAVNTTGIRQVQIRLNGTTAIATNQVVAANVAQLMPVACDYALVAGDYVELVVYQTSGGNLNIDAASNYSPEFSAMWECL